MARLRRPLARSRLAPSLLAAASILCGAGIGLGTAPLRPAEATLVRDPASPCARALAGLPAGAAAPEIALRAPSLALAAAAAFLLVALADGEARLPGAVLAALSPALVAVGREAGPPALAAALGALAAGLLLGRRAP